MWLWPSSNAATRSSESLPGPVMKAHIIDMGQANATPLEFPCGAVLIDAGAQHEEKVDELVRFLNEFFAPRQDLNRTLKSTIPSPLPLSPRRGEGDGLFPLAPRRGEGLG